MPIRRARHHAHVLLLLLHVIRAFALRGQRGQSAAEYLGVIVLVGVIIFALTQTGIGGDIAHFLQSVIGDIGDGKDPTAG